VLPFVPRFTYLVDDLEAVSHEALSARVLSTLAMLALTLLRPVEVR